MEYVSAVQANLVKWMRDDDPLDYYFACCDDGDCLSPWKMVVLSFALHWWMYFMSHPFCMMLFPSYRKLSSEAQAEWNSRVVSTIHAIVAVQGCGHAMLFDPAFHSGSSHYVHTMSEQMQIYLCYSSGYFLYDFILIHLHPSIWDVATFVHHSVAIIANIFVLQYGQAEYFLGFFMFTEITTPFINQRWFFTHSMKESPLYALNGLCMLLGWFIVRVAIMTYMMYLIVVDREAGYFGMSIPMQFMAGPCLFSAYLLNMYWFYLIAKGFYRAVLGGGGGGKAPKKPKTK